jgi:hypothetical protein
VEVVVKDEINTETLSDVSVEAALQKTSEELRKAGVDGRRYTDADLLHVYSLRPGALLTVADIIRRGNKYKFIEDADNLTDLELFVCYRRGIPGRQAAGKSVVSVPDIQSTFTVGWKLREAEAAASVEKDFERLLAQEAGRAASDGATVNGGATPEPHAKNGAPECEPESKPSTGKPEPAARKAEGAARAERRGLEKERKQAREDFEADQHGAVADAVKPGPAWLVDRNDYGNRNAICTAMRAKFTESGIDVEAVEKKIGTPIAIPLTADETFGYTKWARVPSFRILYYTMEGVFIRDYLRLRFLAEVTDKQGGGVRYWSPTGSKPQLYLPPLVNWLEMASDHTRKLTATEGEGKSLKLCFEGIPTVGLQGVWSFGSRGKGIDLLAEFSALTSPERPWERAFQRPWEVVFDADLHVKPSVRAALFAFMARLLNAGAGSIAYVLLPGPEKGVDDYIVAQGLEKYTQLRREQFELLKEAWAMDALFGVVKDPPAIIAKDTGKILNAEQAKLIAPIKHVVTTTPAGKPRRCKAFQFWKDEFAQRTTYETTDYVFGGHKDLPGRVYNCFRDTRCASRKGPTIVPWLKLTKNCFPEPAMMRYAVKWLAHLLQKPTEKMQTALVIYGPPGARKTTWSFIANKLIFGWSNVTKIGAADLADSFNDHFLNHILAVAEEIKGEDPRHDAEALKDQVSGDEVWINTKMVPKYKRRHSCHLIFLSNHRSPVYLRKDDRRFAMSRTLDEGKGLTRKEVGAIRTWLENGGCEAVRYYLENLDISNFDWKEDAPHSKARSAAVREARTDLEEWAEDLMADEDRPRFAFAKSLKEAASDFTGAKHTRRALRGALLDAHAIELGQVHYPTRSDKKHTVWGLHGEADASLSEPDLRTAIDADDTLRLAFFTKNTEK